MEKVELYRQVFYAFKDLCSSGQQYCSFNDYCRIRGVRQSMMRQILKKEFQPVRELQGYTRGFRKDSCRTALYARIYAGFKEMCAAGQQTVTFKSYCDSFGVTRKEIHSYLRNHKLRVCDLPGYRCLGPGGCAAGRKTRYEEVPFENIIFEESGFLPAQDCAITVKVDGHLEVCFPADTDIDVVAKFIRKMGKEARHVES